jgi:tetratricopeptide (TPR) repeat protein
MQVLLPVYLNDMAGYPENDFGFARAANNVAWLYLIGPKEIRNIPKALRLAQKAVKVSPSRGPFLRTLGAAYYYSGRYDEAISPLGDAVKAGEGVYVGYSLLFLAMCCQKRGESEQAYEYYRLALAWQDAHHDLVPYQRGTLRMLRAEAESVLKIGKPEPQQ